MTFTASTRALNTYLVKTNLGRHLCDPRCSLCKKDITKGQEYYAKRYGEVHKSCADDHYCGIIKV